MVIDLKSLSNLTWGLCNIIFVNLTWSHLTNFFGEENFSWFPSKNKVANENLHFQRHKKILVKLLPIKFFYQSLCFLKAASWFFLLQKNSSDESRSKWQIWFYKQMKCCASLVMLDFATWLINLVEIWPKGDKLFLLLI